MKTKITKRLFVMLAVLAISMTQVNISVFAVSETNTEISEENSSVDLATSSNETIANQEETAPESMLIATNKVAAPMSMTEFANFDGIDLSTNPELSYDLAGAFGTTALKSLNVNASFPYDAAAGEKTVTITVDRNFTITTLPGMVRKNGAWVFDATTLPNQLQGIILGATFTKNTDGTTTLENRSIDAYSGKVTYKLLSSVQNVPLNIKLQMVPTFLGNGNADIAFNEPIKVESTSAGVVVDSQSVVKMDYTTKVVPYFYTPTQRAYIYADATTSVTTQPMLLITSGMGQTNEARSQLYKSLTMKYAYPKGLTFVSAKENNNAVVETTIDESDSSFNYVTIKINDFKTSAQGFSMTFLPNETMTAGTVYSITPVNIGASRAIVEMISGEVTEMSAVGQPTLLIEVIAPYTNEAMVIAKNDTVALDNAHDGNAVLGRIGIANVQSDPITNQNFKIDFDTTMIGVKGLQLPRSTGGVTTNIHGVTNLGHTFTIADLPIATLYNRRVTLADDSNITPAAGEYIASIQWTDARMPAGYSATANGTFDQQSWYFGDILATATAGAKAQSILSSAPSGDFTGVDAKSVNLTATFSGTNRSLMSGGTSSLTLISGQTGTISGTFGVAGDSAVNSITAMVGFNMYIREIDGITVRESSFRFIDSSGKTFSVEDGNVTVSTIIDNQGVTVYKFVIPDARYETAGSTAPNVRYSVSINANQAAGDMQVNMSDLIFAEPLNPAIILTASRNMSGTNKYDVSTIRPTTAALFAGSNTNFLTIQPSITFNVITAANLNDGPWGTYDGTADTIINLNPEGNAKYKLAIANTSGQTIQGYKAIIPIPKKGESTGNSMVQSTNFGWNVMLSQPLDVSANNYNYTIKYATSYEMDFEHPSAWKNWDEITNKEDIRAILLVTTDAISSVGEGIDPGIDDIIFDINMDGINADEDAGAINIYSSLIKRDLGGVVANVASEPIAIRLKTGIVKGQTFNDTNRNGLRDTGETGRNGVTVSAYAAGTLTVLETTTTKTIDGVEGSYEFLGLDKSQVVDIVFTNPSTDNSVRFSPFNASGSVVSESSDHLSAKASNITPSTASALVVYAGFMTPVTISMNAGTGTTSDATIARYPGEAITSEPSATKTGYSFNGWFTASTGGSKVMFPYTVGTTDTTLYAQYLANFYTITFDNQGSLSSNSVATDNLISTPTTPNKTGYTFTGWFSAGTGGTQWNFATDKMPPNNITLYAQFMINNYTMTYDNEGSTSTALVQYDSTTSAPTAPSKIGYTFSGWFDATSGGTQWNFATDKMPAANKALYAQYSINSYVLTLNDQGITSTQAVDFDGLATQPTNPTKAGYTFSGWFSASTGGTQWNFATSKMPATNTTLYAQFTAVNQTISFNVNGGKATSKPANIVAGTDSSINIDAVSTPQKDGYAFIGWFDGATQVSGTITMPIGGLSLQAHWSATDQVIQFNSNGGTGVGSITQVTDSSVDLSTSTTTRAGYQFDGWFDATDIQYEGTITMPAGGLQLIAHWSALDQTITFDSNGGSAVASITQATDTTVDLDAIIPTKYANKFLGWFDADDNQYSGTINMPVGGLALKAKWQDLIVDGIWKIEAHNVKMSMTEFNDFVDSNTIEQEILTRSQAKAWDVDTDELVGRVELDLSSLVAVSTPGTYIVQASVPNPDETLLATRETGVNINADVLMTSFEVDIYDDTTAPAETLPITGNSGLEINILIGLILLVASGIAIKKRK